MIKDVHLSVILSEAKNLVLRLEDANSPKNEILRCSHLAIGQVRPPQDDKWKLL
jgi:hypothetical protein